MSEKYLIFGATGSIGSNLSKMMAENNKDVQLIGRDEENLKNINQQELDRRLNKCRYRGEPCRYD